MNPKRRVLIEDWLPAQAIGVECMRENSTGLHPPPNRLHVWWARRPLLRLTLSTNSLDRAGDLIDIAQPFGARALWLSVNVSGELSGEGPQVVRPRERRQGREGAVPVQRQHSYRP